MEKSRHREIQTFGEIKNQRNQELNPRSIRGIPETFFFKQGR